MIAEERLRKEAQQLLDDISYAKVYIEGVETRGNILKKTIEDTVVKVFLSLSMDKGKVTKTEIYDKDDELVQIQDMEVIKSSHQGFIAVVEIHVKGETINV